MSNLRAYVLCRFANKSGIYSSWINDTELPTVVVDESLPDWHIPDDAGILITHMHYRWDELATLRRILNQGRVPILILFDGILDYRNTWEHPNLVDGSMFQPLFGHKLACVGKGQARLVESWGNPGRCEVVGLPRLDQVDAKPVPPVNDSGPFRLLIATATTPAFNDHQRASVLQSLQEIRKWLDKNPSLNGREINVTWRLSDGLDSEIGVADDVASSLKPSLSEVIDRADAVITTPSTLFLESILRKRPTALLDFQNSPQFVPAAWTITSARQLNGIIPELAQPPKPKMIFQDFVLHDQLECRSPSKPRMLKLIHHMVDAGQRARASRQPIELAACILNDSSGQPDSVMACSAPPQIRANRPSPLDQEVDRLQIELSAAIRRLGQLPQELAGKNQTITRLKLSIDRLRHHIESLRIQIVQLKKNPGG